MSERAIAIKELSKAYRIGLKEELPDTLIASFFSWLKAPARNFRRLKRLNTFSNHTEEPDLIWALKDINLTIARGEVVGVIGKNGAGKSTLLKILSRITQPTRGQAVINGRVSSLLEVGTGFHPELSGRENVYMNGTILGMTKKEIDRKFDRIVDFAGVEKFIDTPIKRYSSGMKVRLAFSVAAHLDPEVLIVDEVLAVGDVAFQKKCIGKMHDVAGHGRTVLFVSHNMGAVNTLCSRGILIENGQIKLDSTPNEAIQCYLAEASDRSEIQLCEREDREGDGKVRFTRIQVLNADSDFHGQQPVSGAPMDIILDYESENVDRLDRLEVSVVIGDQKGHTLFTCSTMFNNAGFESVPAKGQLLCRIPRLPVVKGNYFVKRLWAAVGGDPSDAIDNVLQFEVMDGNYFGTGRNPRPHKHGQFLVDHEWECAGALSPC